MLAVSHHLFLVSYISSAITLPLNVTCDEISLPEATPSSNRHIVTYLVMTCLGCLVSEQIPDSSVRAQCIILAITFSRTSILQSSF